MTIHTLKRTQVLPLTLPQAWEYFSHPKNLQEITPPWLHFEILSELPEKMYPGLILVYRIKAIAGIPMTWVTEITHLDEPSMFVDEQRLGPYKFWHHRHSFKETENGVLMEDLVHYAMPYGGFGVIIHDLLVRGKLETIFDFRREYLQRRFA